MGASGDRSIADVLGDIVDNLQGIIRAEVRLAKAELREETTRAKRGLLLLVVAGLIGSLALAFFLLAAVYGLAMVIPAWAAALVVAASAAIIAGVTVSVGLKSFRDLGLPKTTATIQETVQWAKTRVR